MVSEGILWAPGEPLGGLRDLPGAGLILGPIFRENLQTHVVFFTVWEPLGILKPIKRMKPMKPMNRICRKWCTTGSSDPRFSAPEARMTVVRQANSLKLT